VLETVNLNYKNMWNKNALNIAKSRGTVTFQSEVVGIIRLKEKTIIIAPSLPGVFFDYVLRMWLFVNLRYKKFEIPRQYSLSATSFGPDISEIFVNELTLLTQKGLSGDYIEINRNAKYVRGKINYKNYFILRPHGLLNCTMDEFSLDHKLNQLIYHCLLKVRHLSNDNKILNRISYLLNFFKNLTYFPHFSVQEIDSIQLNRETSYYEKVLELCKIILKNLTISILGYNLEGYSFLVDFNLLFEDFIKKVLFTHSRENEFSSWKDFKVFGRYKAHDERIKEKKCLPDLFYRYNASDNSAKFVIDIKNKFGDPFSNEDIYQVVFYSMFLNTNKVILIYPSVTRKKAILFRFKFQEKEFHLYAVFFNIAGEEQTFVTQLNNFVDSIYEIVTERYTGFR